MSHQRFQVVPAAYVILRRQGLTSDARPREEVLLQLRQGTGYKDGHWATAAAGHVEAGESVLEAAVREAREEMGIVVDPADLVPVTSLHRTARDGNPLNERVDWFYECRTWTGIPTIQEPDKTGALDWFPLDDLPVPIVPHEAFVYERLASGLRPIHAFGWDHPGM